MTRHRSQREAGDLRRARDRDVLLAAAGAVALVLGVEAVAVVYAPLRVAIREAPTIPIALVVVTVVVLARALSRRSR